MKKIIPILLISLLSFKPKPKEKELDLMPVVDVSEILLDHKYFKVAYDCRHNTTSWVYYKMTKDMVLKEAAKRKDNFHNDPFLNSCDVSVSDYSNSGYDRGHLVAAEDMDWSQDAMDETFVVTNMTPQVPKFNRGIWKKLEQEIRDIAVEEELIYIVKGTVLPEERTTIGLNRIAVPEYCYATLVNKALTKSWCFILQNKEAQDKDHKPGISIDKLEQITKIDFFYNLPDNIESKLEQ